MARNIALLLALFFVFSCGISKTRIEIPDYLIEPNGRALVGTKSLNAFLFENNVTNLTFQQFISSKFRTNTLQETALWITIDAEKFQLIFYDSEDFEKYFGASNYTVLNQETNANIVGNQSKFIAISIINQNNEDCLLENSLYRNIVISYLKNLKDEYIKK